MKEQILLEALIVHIVEPNPSYCDLIVSIEHRVSNRDHSVHSAYARLNSHADRVRCRIHDTPHRGRVTFTYFRFYLRYESC